MTPGQTIKTFTTKKGNTVVIRYPKWEDLDDVLAFANNLVEEEALLALSKKQTRAEEAKWMADTFEKIETGKKIKLVAVVNGKYAGNCEIRIHDNRESHVGDIGIALSKDYRDEGIGAELLTTLIAQGKNAGLKLLILYCYENNDRALHLYEKLGFTRSGLVPGTFAYKGSYIGDVTLYLPLK
ncbi:MAG: GNAT family N-acetyltransferase [Candidatus Gottesmanbacteria bacterium]|nr:GNAT family N-acetyltransferase [Candidatus Gottesmanbacteria bacterium]